MIKIFVSSTFEDLKDYRKRARELITALGFVDIAMERWGADARPAKANVQAAARESDIYVGIVAWRYGSLVPDESGISYIEYEYDLAGHIPRLLFLMDPDHPWPPNSMDRDRTLIEAFRDKVTRGQTLRCLFTSEWDFSLELVTSLRRFVPQSRGYQLLSDKDKAVLELRRLAQEDFLARRDEIENQADESARQWFISGIARCNLGQLYIPREAVLQSVAKWLLPREPPYLFLVGPSGIGKTNFLLEFTQRLGEMKQDASGRGVLIFPLGQYNVVDHIDNGRRLSLLLDNLRSFLSHQQYLAQLTGGGILEALIVSGRVVLALDGLDEFARNHGDAECEQLFVEMKSRFITGDAKIIVSCRDHTYKRLAQRPWFPERTAFSEVSVPDLTVGEVTTALAKRLKEDSACYAAVTGSTVLLGFARKPLLLEIICTIRPDRWKTLRNARTPARLYDAWFDEVIAATTSLEDEPVEDTRITVGKIAGEMLRARSDVISESSLTAANVTSNCLSALTRKPFGIFIKETKDEWGFVHASFREFALAKTAAIELQSNDYRLLADTDSFDYVGAETYRFLKELIPADDRLLKLLERAVNTDAANPIAWNNIVRNAFEAIGMIGDTSAERLIDSALALLDPHAEGERARPRVFKSTKWNIVRCLERLHRSAPRPYCEYMMTVVWPDRPDFMCFGAVAIRGFHMRRVRPGYFPPMHYLHDRNTGDNPRQQEVSDGLLRVLENLEPQTSNDEERFLEINCAHALIRWLHEVDVPRVQTLLGKGGLTGDSKGNLFQAFLRLKKPDIFEGTCELFAGMILHWCYITRPMLPKSFVFQNVSFRRRQASRIEGFQADAFDGCKDDLV